MKLKTSTLVIGAGVVAGAIVLYLAKKPAAAAVPAPAPPPQPQPPKPPPLGAGAPPGPYDAYVSRSPYGAGPSSYNPNPMFQYYPQGK